MATRFAKDYVVVMIDTDRMTGGAELAAELRNGKRGGIPWLVILDGDGQTKITSDGPNGNVGCPAKPEEIDYFLTMVDKTRQHMSEDDRFILEREMRAYGKKLMQPRRATKGQRAYSQAVSKIASGQFTEAVQDLAEAIGDGRPAVAMLTDPALRPLREDPDRRPELFELLKDNVTESHIQMVDVHEPGVRIRLQGRLVGMKTGEPIASALMQFFHTDAGGEYRPGMDAGGGAGNPRLFGYLRTDNQGRFTVDTIMPERYTQSAVPRHVHYRVWAEGYPQLNSECFFDSDPNLHERTRRSAPDRNFPIVVLKKDEERRSVGTLTVRLPK